MSGSFNNKGLRLNFDGSDRIERNFSQAGQDLFVLSLLNGKRNGVFLDLGCGHPIVINNTFLLEHVFGWNGLSIDIYERHFDLYIFRNSKTLVADCTNLDWDLVLHSLGTSSIDYLSIDLEPPSMTLECLKSVPFDRLKAAVITFEHDAYRAGESVREPSRELLEGKGYVRCCTDVKLNGLEFEDWYYDPSRIDPSRALVIAGERKNWENFVFNIGSE